MCCLSLAIKPVSAKPSPAVCLTQSSLYFSHWPVSSLYTSHATFRWEPSSMQEAPVLLSCVCFLLTCLPSSFFSNSELLEARTSFPLTACCVAPGHWEMHTE